LLSASGQLLDDLRGLIRQTREGVAQAVNTALVLLSTGKSAIASARKSSRESVPTTAKEIIPTLAAACGAKNRYGSEVEREELHT
jgi:hypothetical protein